MISRGIWRRVDLRRASKLTAAPLFTMSAPGKRQLKEVDEVLDDPKRFTAAKYEALAPVVFGENRVIDRERLTRFISLTSRLLPEKIDSNFCKKVLALIPKSPVHSPLPSLSHDKLSMLLKVFTAPLSIWRDQKAAGPDEHISNTVEMQLQTIEIMSMDMKNYQEQIVQLARILLKEEHIEYDHLARVLSLPKSVLQKLGKEINAKLEQTDVSQVPMGGLLKIARSLLELHRSNTDVMLVLKFFDPAMDEILASKPSQQEMETVVDIVELLDQELPHFYLQDKHSNILQNIVDTFEKYAESGVLVPDSAMRFLSHLAPRSDLACNMACNFLKFSTIRNSSSSHLRKVVQCLQSILENNRYSFIHYVYEIKTLPGLIRAKNNTSKAQACLARCINALLDNPELSESQGKLLEEMFETESTAASIEEKPGIRQKALNFLVKGKDTGSVPDSLFLQACFNCSLTDFSMVKMAQSLNEQVRNSEAFESIESKMKDLSLLVQLSAMKADDSDDATSYLKSANILDFIKAIYFNAKEEAGSRLSHVLSSINHLLPLYFHLKDAESQRDFVEMCGNFPPELKARLNGRELLMLLQMCIEVNPENLHELLLAALDLLPTIKEQRCGKLKMHADRDVKNVIKAYTSWLKHKLHGEKKSMPLISLGVVASGSSLDPSEKIELVSALGRNIRHYPKILLDELGKDFILVVRQLMKMDSKSQLRFLFSWPMEFSKDLIFIIQDLVEGKEGKKIETLVDLFALGAKKNLCLDSIARTVLKNKEQKLDKTHTQRLMRALGKIDMQFSKREFETLIELIKNSFKSVEEAPMEVCIDLLLIATSHPIYMALVPSFDGLIAKLKSWRPDVIIDHSGNDPIEYTKTEEKELVLQKVKAPLSLLSSIFINETFRGEAKSAQPSSNILKDDFGYFAKRWHYFFLTKGIDYHRMVSESGNLGENYEVSFSSLDNYFIKAWAVLLNFNALPLSGTLYNYCNSILRKPNDFYQPELDALKKEVKIEEGNISLHEFTHCNATGWIPDISAVEGGKKIAYFIDSPSFYVNHFGGPLNGVSNLTRIQRMVENQLEIMGEVTPRHVFLRSFSF